MQSHSSIVTAAFDLLKIHRQLRGKGKIDTLQILSAHLRGSQTCTHFALEYKGTLVLSTLNSDSVYGRAGVMSLRSHEDLCCPVCQDVFTDPLVLGCSHSLCRGCLESWWNEKGIRECPVCKQVSAQSAPASNLALRNLCESLLAELHREEQSDTEINCKTHTEAEVNCKGQSEAACGTEQTYKRQTEAEHSTTLYKPHFDTKLHRKEQSEVKLHCNTQTEAERSYKPHFDSKLRCKTQTDAEFTSISQPKAEHTSKTQTEAELNYKRQTEAEHTYKPQSDAMCGLHSEKLTLFCLEHQSPVCLVCRDSEKHVGHHFRPIDEASKQHKHKLDDFLKPLRAKVQTFDGIQAEYAQTLAHVAAQAQRVEERIRAQFERAYGFLRAEEQSRVRALREEEQEKSRAVAERAHALRLQVAPLQAVLEQAEEQLGAESVAFLQRYKSTVGRVQRCPLLEEPAPVTDALINEATHVGNLLYWVWTRMSDLVEFCPVLFDPNTLDPHLSLTPDLSAVTRADHEEALPHNPERFRKYFAVLGSEGFSSGTAQWEVDVSRSAQWRVGVLAHGLPLEQAQWVLWLFNGVLAAQAPGKPLSIMRDLRPPRRVKISLYCDLGQVRFIDSHDGSEICALRFPPGLRMFPFVKTWDTASIVRANVKVLVDFKKENQPSKKLDLRKMLDNVSVRQKSKTATEEASFGAQKKEETDEEEDDVDKQKRLNKERFLREQQEAKAAGNLDANGGKEKSQKKEEEMEEEDDVAKQKRLNKERLLQETNVATKVDTNEEKKRRKRAIKKTRVKEND
ncbi:hypothetical protein WMY93_028389 [Mugilogobius chulae]|uniref:Uncharacterized protein n=1 Tax=Mugilogobius chulae TaxID=88201 RepID=A0AAW0MP83_9GOBI